MTPVTRRVLRGLAATTAVLAIAFVGARAYTLRTLERGAFRPGAARTETPATFGAAFEAVTIPVGDRRVAGHFVPGPTPDATAVLILHGNGETAGSWAEAQALMRRAGVASLVVDYAGYGRSGGVATVAGTADEARAAWAWLAGRTRGRRVLVGHSLGAAVALDAASTLDPRPDGVVASAPWASAREAVVRVGLVPAERAWTVPILVPNVWDNVSAARRWKASDAAAALLVVRGTLDSLSDGASARAVARAGDGRLVEVRGATHTSIFRLPAPDLWAPVLAFIRGDARPASARAGAAR